MYSCRSRSVFRLRDLLAFARLWRWDSNSNFATSNNGYTKSEFWSRGASGAITFNVLPLGPVKLDLDLRGSTKPGTDVADLVLIGIKLGVNAPLVRFKPYVQASGGYLAVRTRIVGGAVNGASSSDMFAVYEVLGGIDCGLVPFFDLRLLEIGAGRGYNLAGAGSTAGNYQVTLFTKWHLPGLPLLDRLAETFSLRNSTPSALLRSHNRSG